MRDLAIFLIVFGSLPFILRTPYIGILMWSWLSYMNPHRLAWGFAYDFPFALIVAIALLTGLLFSREPKRIPVTGLIVVWGIFIVWMSITTVFAFFPDQATRLFIKVIKIQLITFVSIMVMGTKERINLLVWVITISIGYYGVKGGLFAILTAGSYRIWGPPESYIEDNNALAVALLMLLPLMYYLQVQSANKWVKLGLLGAIGFCVFSIIGSYSRGALLASFSMAGFLWLKSRGRKKLIVGFLVVLAFPLLFMFMPEKWHSRMDTIQNYEQDESANQRLRAWKYCLNLANDRLMGGGFDSWSPLTYSIYAPDSPTVHAAHSIYFGPLGDHGWVGLGLFLLIGVIAWRTGSWIIRNAKGYIELNWIVELTRMIQVSLIAYATGGTFLSLAYFDLYWQLIAILVMGKVLVKNYLDQAQNLPPIRIKG